MEEALDNRLALVFPELTNKTEKAGLGFKSTALETREGV